MGAEIQRFVDLRLLNTRTRAFSLLALFVSVQMADACMTAIGVGRYGVAAEANPMLALPIALFGPAVVLTTAKGMAILGAVVLHRCSWHLVLALLTVMYVFLAIMPWAWALGVA